MNTAEVKAYLDKQVFSHLGFHIRKKAILGIPQRKAKADVQILDDQDTALKNLLNLIQQVPTPFYKEVLALHVNRAVIHAKMERGTLPPSDDWIGIWGNSIKKVAQSIFQEQIYKESDRYKELENTCDKARKLISEAKQEEAIKGLFRFFSEVESPHRKAFGEVLVTADEVLSNRGQENKKSSRQTSALLGILSNLLWEKEMIEKELILKARKQYGFVDEIFIACLAADVESAIEMLAMNLTGTFLAFMEESEGKWTYKGKESGRKIWQ